MEEQLHEARVASDDVAAREVRVTGAAGDVGNLLLDECGLRVADAAYFGDGIDAGRQQRRDVALKCLAEHVEDRDARLLDAGGGQRGRPDDVAHAVDVRGFGPPKPRT